jgi:hypothetical protein
MSWQANQVFEFYTEPRRLAVQGDAWRDMLTVPASDLKPLHSYALVVTGYHGNYVPGTGANVVNAGAIQVSHNGLYVADTLHRFDVSFGAMQFPQNPIFCQPFTILATVSMTATPQDIIVQARCEDAGASTMASFDLEGLAVQVYDMSAWTGTQYLSTATTGTLAEYWKGSLSPLLNLSSDLAHGSPAKRWLIFYSVVLEAQDTNVNAATWVTLDPSQPKSDHLFYDRQERVGLTGSWIGHSPRGRVGYHHRHHVGTGRVLEVDAAGVRPTVWAADMWVTANPTKPLAVKILAVPLDDMADEVHSDYTGYSVHPYASWSPASNPDWRLAGVETSFIDTLRILAVARGTFDQPTSPVSNFYSALELDSERLSPRPLGPMRVYCRANHEVQALHRVGRGVADAGHHCIRHLLYCDVEEPASFETQVYDHQILVLSTAKGYGYIWPPGDLIGPEVVIVPGKESVDVSSLLSFPISPSATAAFELLDPAFELKTKTGYTISWPLALEPKRKLDFSWTGLTATERDTLIAWLRERADAGSAVAWGPPDEHEDLPFVLISDTIRWSIQGGRLFEVSVGAIELRYTGA